MAWEIPIAAGAAIALSPPLARVVSLAAVREPPFRLFTAVNAAVAVSLWAGTGHADALQRTALTLTALAVIPAVWIDLYLQRLPNVLVLTPYPLVGACVAATARPDAMIRCALAAGAAIAIHAAGVALGQMGAGDAKLAGVLAMGLAWDGYAPAVVAGVAAVVAGGATALAARGGRVIPYGPALALGAWAGLVLAM
ncbi:prepilin peptidase [Salininema proteolyticum]|uniref:Prepilin peptidase n=1 Tax=Salininema proteolyticum TaxID=1607685 RepID=A0ABV8U0Q8_9ACTN